MEPAEAGAGAGASTADGSARSKGSHRNTNCFVTLVALWITCEEPGGVAWGEELGG